MRSAGARLRGGRGLDVARDDAPMRARRRDAAEIDAGLARQPPRQRRHESCRRQRAGPKLRSGVRTSKNGSSGPLGAARGGAGTRSRRGGRGTAQALWPARRSSGGSLRLRRRAIARDHRDHGADQRHLAHADADFRERAGRGRRHLHRHLVGLDLEQVVARLHGVAGRLEPLRDLALSHGLAELRHQHVHQPVLTSCVPNTRNSSCRPY